ncbi:type VII secretion protein EccCa [Streptomyces mobaraensis]|uniref:Type VII secretion protein EccCa n=1 Tax=Streptomyces mobaraensis TaxID=35621 RepID=A0A5N5VWV2_STRMB|nr:type VII secretion protein EccCa [Streptomyces mobaraensis]KAB7832871.1 type VII secretion protein EccCa [Streptomyces mobaraensis]
MSQIVVKRPPRVLPPEPDADELQLESPPELPRGQQEGMAMQLLPMLGMGSSVVFFFMPGTQPFMKVMGVMMLLSTVAMAIAQVVRYRKGSQGAAVDGRRDYLKYLAQTRRKVRRTARAQRDAQFYLHPGPEQLWALVAERSRLWERRVSDKDFGQVRIGLGPQQLWTPLVAPTTAPVDELEPLSAGAMQQFLATHGSLDRLPVAVSMRAFYHVVVTGEADAVRGAARSMVAGLAALHSPDDLVIAVVADGEAAPEWDWTKWLPHTQAPGTADGAGTKRLFSDHLPEVEELLGKRLEGRTRFSRDAQPLLDQPHVVVVLDGGAVPPESLLASPEGLQGVTVLEIAPGEEDEPRGGLCVTVRPGTLRLESATAVYQGVPDDLPVPVAEALARQMAPLCLGAAGDDEEPLLANLEFTDLLGLGDAASVDTATTWRPRSRADRLRVPIGVGEDGTPVMLDLKEAAEDGMGPHGLCVGATGSGKSELLRTLVLGLAVTHSSENLNFVLADFKGGATFSGMAELPHVAAVITNLADDLTLVDRMRDSITGELQRRQELLRAAGNYANLNDYEKARAAGAPLEPLASLVLVIDEFSELLTAKPDFIDMFIQIGRIGRSLGVHLLLASQRLEEGRLRGLDTYLSYRIGLRTFSAAESRTALGVPDAYHLPSVPGSGYLKFGTDEMTRFKAAYVSGTYRDGAGALTRTGPLPADRRPVLFTAAPVPVRYQAPDPDFSYTPARPDDDALADTVLDVIVRRLEGQGPAAHQVWLPPLNKAPSMDQLLPRLTATPERGLHCPDPQTTGGLRVPLGLLDKPFEQRRDVLVRDFSGAAGHMLIVGGPRSGKSTLLRTLVSGFALTHTPHEVQFYGLDFGGGGLSAVEGLPHVGGIASRLDPEKVRRTVAEVTGILNRREEFFRDNSIDSIATYRRLRAAGRLPDQPWGDVFLVIDGWQTFKTDYEMLEPYIADITTRGLGLGVHLVVTVSRYMEMRAALKDQFLSRLELRLGDPLDSELDRKIAVNVPVGVPGRGITAEKLHFLAGLPRIDGGSGGGDDLSDATADFVKTAVDAWPGPHAPQVRMLPRMLSARELPDGHAQPGRGVAIGLDEMNLAPVFVNFDTDPFFAVYGESESGKTALLRLLIKQLTERYSPEEALFLVADYRRSLLECVPEPYLVGYATTQNAFDEYLTDMNTLIGSRIPGTDVTPQQLRDRSWWKGPRAFIIVDDYDLVATSSGNPMAQLVDNLPYARDAGVNIILARSSAGAGRSAYEPFIQRFKELGAQGVLLSGNSSEGELLGNVKPRPLPPGRGLFVSRRGGASLVQTGWVAPAE